MPDDTERLRVAVYRSLAATGNAPTPGDLAHDLGIGLPDVQVGLRALHEARHLVIDPTGRIVMAHPFATIPLGFSVMGRHTLWWGGCAWDSLAIPNLVPDEPEVLVATRCLGCGRPHALVVGRDGPPEGGHVVHFLVPVASMWDDVLRTCGNQRLFCDRVCVERWLGATGQAMGYVADLATTWRLAAHWYDGRLDEGYRRREPANAAAYFRDVGLRGAFWGL